MTPPEIDILVGQMMEAYASDAVDAARANFNIELDYSPASVKAVEELLGRVYPAVRRGWFRRFFRIGLSDGELETICKMFGGYIGEVVRRQKGGTWQLVQDPIGTENVIALVNGEGRIFPPSKVYKRLVNGAEDDVWFYFQVVTDLAERVGEPA
ncbi:MAG TPA: hypothetical protein VE010_19110 [Thermoanaerobaculia bacterium]|nr:hypothetical protein [Thermoanaerobaculia bacterium]